jgi:hypothetical protein
MALFTEYRTINITFPGALQLTDPHGEFPKIPVGNRRVCMKRTTNQSWHSFNLANFMIK